MFWYSRRLGVYARLGSASMAKTGGVKLRWLRPAASELARITVEPFGGAERAGRQRDYKAQ